MRCAHCGDPSLLGRPWCSAHCRAQIAERVARAQDVRRIRCVRGSEHAGVRTIETEVERKAKGRASRRYRTDVTDKVELYERARLSL